MFRIFATRGGVCAADDMDAHEREFAISAHGNLWEQLRTILAEVARSDYLPYSSIWVVKSGDIPIAVIGDHWSLPEMVHTTETLPVDKLAQDADGRVVVRFNHYSEMFTTPGPGKLVAIRGLAEGLLEAARLEAGTSACTFPPNPEPQEYREYVADAIQFAHEKERKSKWLSWLR
jgi:hypothetical protein